MGLDLPAGDLAVLAASLAAAGLIAGILAGIFGIGGGAIIVPVMYQALVALGFDDSVSFHVALGTAISSIVPTAIRSFAAHRVRGAVDMALLRDWIVAVPAGAVAATIVAAYASGDQLKAIFAFVAFLIGLRFLFNRATWRLGTELPGLAARVAVGGFVGFFATLMGVGGGVMSNVFMTVYGRPIHQAVATGAGVGVLVAVPGTLGYIAAGWGTEGLPPFSLGYVNLLGLALIMPLGTLAAPLGVKLAHRLSRRHLEIAFGLFLILMAIRFTVSLF